MKSIISVALLLSLILTCCVRPKPVPMVRLRPQYTGIPAETSYIVKEYFELAKKQNIHLKNKITIGFANINMDTVVGTCTVMPFFREIDVDREYWDESPIEKRKALLFHELTHCYCGRGHDYERGKKYDKKDAAKSVLGRYSDGCPLSLMFPNVMDEYCMQLHYRDYVVEMFSRCKPYLGTEP